MKIYIHNFHLITTMEYFEYMKLPIYWIQQEIMDNYRLRLLSHKGHINWKTHEVIYILPQAWLVENIITHKWLSKFRYHPYNHTKWLWNHEMKHIYFSRVVNRFCVKYTNMGHPEKLVKAPQNGYKSIAINWWVVPAPDGIFISILTC